MSGERFDATTLIVQRLGSIESKLDENTSMTGDIRISVATHAEILKAQHAQLVEHIRRTKQLEERVKPVEEHVVRLSAGMKIAGWLAAAAGLTISVLEFFKG